MQDVHERRDRQQMTSGNAQNAVVEGLPDLLTQEEAVEVLCLDRLGLRDPKESLRHLRRTGQIGFVKVAGKILIPRQELIAYVDRQRVRSHP